MPHLAPPARGRWAAGAALAALLVGLAPAAPAAAAPDDAIASASYGEAEIWVQRKPSDRAQRELVFKSSREAVARVLDVTVPERNARFTSDWAENIALGLDRRHALTTVLQSRRGLYWTHVNGTPRLHRVPGTTRDDTFPSIFRGRLAYGHSAGAGGSVVRLGALTGGPAQTAWSNLGDPSREWVVRDTAVGIDDTVAIVTVRDGAGNGGFQALLAGPGRKPRRLLNLGLGDTHVGGLAIAVSRSGRRLAVSRILDGTTTTFTYALPSGRKLAQRRAR